MSDRFKVKFATDVILRKDNQVLLSLRQNSGWMDGKFHFVGGHVEGGEPAENAAAREAAEELGITIYPKELSLVFVTHRLNGDLDDEYVTLYFEARTWQGEITNCEPDISGGLEWFDLENLPDNIVPHTKSILGQYAQGKNYFSTIGDDE